MMKEIFIKTAEQRVLSLFLLNPDRAFYGREVSKKIKTSLGATSNALRSLEKSGILNSEKKGKTSLYSLNPLTPYLDRLKVLNLLFTVEPLIEKIKKLSKRVILYGSCAAGTFTADSDLDIFIVSEKREEVMRTVYNFRSALDIEIKPVIKKQVEWMQLEKSEPEFFAELNNGMVLWERPINESSL